MVGLIVLLQIFLLFCIIALIDGIIEKYFCGIFKYRIVKKSGEFKNEIYNTKTFSFLVLLGRCR